MDIYRAATIARKGISNYCIHECHAYCCRKGHLTLNRKELAVIIQNKAKEYEDRIAEIDPETIRLFIGKNDSPCPCLSDNHMCNIHTHKGRPRICKDFPILIKNEIIFINKDCPAVQDNKLYAFISKVLKEGYDIRYI
jgi:hypothetical protein